MSKQIGRAEEISVAVLYPGNRVDKMLTPLQASNLEVAVEPDDAYERDLVICDNADRDLGKEVLKKPFHDAKVIYRMRGDIFHELDLWGMHPVKKWVATQVVLRNVDGVIAVTDRLAELFQSKTGIQPVGSAGMWKDVADWPTVDHTRETLHLTTLTNANYWQKVKPIAEWAETVNTLLDRVGGEWRVCGDGTETDRLQSALEPYEHVTFAGYVDAFEELAQANAVLHPSYLDGQPNAIIEGMASRLPVITNDFAAFTRYDGPITIAHNQIQLQSTLEDLTDPAYRQRHGQRGVEYVRENHSPTAIANDYEQFAATLIHESD